MDVYGPAISPCSHYCVVSHIVVVCLGVEVDSVIIDIIRGARSVCVNGVVEYDSILSIIKVYSIRVTAT